MDCFLQFFFDQFLTSEQLERAKRVRSWSVKVLENVISSDKSMFPIK